METRLPAQSVYKKGTCTKTKYYSRSEVKAAIDKLKSKRVNGQPIAGSSTLRSWKCHKCTSKKGEVFHIGHFNRGRILNG